MGLTSYPLLTPVVNAIAADAGENSEDDPQTSFTAIGDIEAARRTGPPRVVWVPGGGPITQPDQDESEASKIGYQRNPRCQVHFVGSTYTEAETLLRDWMAAVRRTQQGTVVLGDESKTPETITGANRYGITVEATVHLPQSYEVYESATVLSTSHSITVVDQ